MATVNAVEYTDLAKAIEAAINTEYAVEIKADIDLTDEAWTPVEYNIGKLVVNGNNKILCSVSSRPTHTKENKSRARILYQKLRFI